MQWTSQIQKRRREPANKSIGAKRKLKRNQGTQTNEKKSSNHRQKNGSICYFWTFWPVIQLINYLINYPKRVRLFKIPVVISNALPMLTSSCVYMTGSADKAVVVGALAEKA